MNSIKKLEVFGFKSFYNRQEIVFPPHMNVIMGPNGSGKSNVLEALTFVLGKSSRKELRAEKMGDLVYNGSKKLPPAKFAKVSVIIDNKNKKMPIDDDEVKIARKVDKEGRSIFKVNGKRQPREYIKNLLYHAGIDPDGYNLVMQGEIEKFISLSSEERRKIIEDLSGISIYEEKKHKCLLELDKVQKKINDARIILNEKIKHMGELKKEKEQAEKYSEMQEKLNYKKAAKITVEMREIEKEENSLQKQFDKKNEEIDKKSKERYKLIAEINSENQNLGKLNKDLEMQGETEQVDLNKQIEDFRNKNNEFKTLINSEKNEIRRISERKEQLTKDINLNLEKKETANKNISGLLEKINNKKVILKDEEEKFDKMNDVDKERVRLFSIINDIEKEILELKNKIGEYQKLQTMQEEKEEISKNLVHIKADLTAKIEQNSEVSGKLSELEENKEKVSRELHLLEGKHEALIRLLDRGVQSIMQAKKAKKLKGVHGIVSELGKASEEYSLPLKVAAGSRANAVVVDDIEAAKKCIEYLREHQAGIAMFLPLDKIKSSTSEKEKLDKEGFVDFAINLIKFKPQYKNIFNFVFQDTVIIKNLESAKKIGINKHRMVTLSGDLFEKSGAIHGGFRRKEGIGFKEEPVEEKMEEYRSALIAINSEIESLEPEREKTGDEVALLRGRVYEMEEKMKKFEKIDLSEIEGLREEIKKREEKHNKIWSEIKELPKKVAQDYLNKLSEKLKNHRDEIANLEGERKGYEIELQIIERDLERANELIKGLEKESVSFKKRIEDNQKALEKNDEKLKKKLEDEKKFHGKLKELYSKRNKMIDNIKEFEIEKNKIETIIEVMRKDAQDFQLKLAEIKAKIEGKRTALEEFKGIEVKITRETGEELAEQIKEIEIKIENYGPVNMRALEVYHIVEKEHESLQERTEKLFKEKEEVLEVMNEVEGQKKETFMETFNYIAENFSRVFGTLSIKGEGSLILESPENIFEGGLDIIAKPGGKKMISLRSMSGGEKTLTTLAFIFAVQEYQPSPFYVMDEVDAALDKENSERLGMLISEYSKTSQFILISHNDSIISQGDNIYGVHMNELGESRIISMKLPAK